MPSKQLLPRLFHGYGIELEYMIVHEDSLDIFPIADNLLHQVSGSYEGEVAMGALGWSNEFVLHVVELKTIGPVPSFENLTPLFQENVTEINRLLSTQGACLMPTAMHPWMDPSSETVLWPHGNHEIYETYNRIFDCRGHGWANLQSSHVNLAFCGDDEFARLHTAIRLILPLIPALAASSPVVQGKLSGSIDTRLNFYRQNQRKVPFISGKIIPEAVFTMEGYRRNILESIYQHIAPHDPDNILQHEWLNSRGAIARFDRNAIEIRLIDVQECPKADLAVAFAVSSILKALISERWTSFETQAMLSEDQLSVILSDTILYGETAKISDKSFLKQFGHSGSPLSASELWKLLMKSTTSDLSTSNDDLQETLYIILEHGTLAGRIIRALGENFSHRKLQSVYKELCRCLSRGELFGV